MCDHVLHLGVHLLVADAALLRLCDDRIGNRVRIMFLQAGCNLQRLGFLHIAEGLNVHDSRRRAGQRAGLIKDNRIGLGNRLHELSTLHGDLSITRLADGGEHRKRHRELQRAGEVDHQEGQTLCHISREQEGQRRAAERVRHQAVRKMVGSRLGVGL